MEDFDPQAFAESIEAVLLGGPRTMSPGQLSDRADLDRADGRRLWQSMGFAQVEESDYETAMSLTDLDLFAAQRVKQAVDLGIGTFDEIVGLSRLTGQIFAQLADSEGEAMFQLALKKPESFASTISQLTNEILPFVEELHAYVWRRQLAAFVARKAMAIGKHPGANHGATVGFADISGYTMLSRTAEPADLADLLELFESVATQAVGAHNGRVVKLIGDAVLYTSHEPADGADIAADLLQNWPADRPPLHVGVASGPILRRLGDIFGPTVNIASRLTSLGSSGEIRVDERTATALQNDPRFELEEQEPRGVRGYEQLRSWSLIRVGTSRRRSADGSVIPGTE
ncbi:MAG: adenylate/guanylate cyclase domain-containing protein [Nocardiaceae bacterium]|nr:adenylate/guanylate cyclase domain-containing protein [Nocardiaceae bacterium]